MLDPLEEQLHLPTAFVESATALSDILLTWISPLSGLLMILDHHSWPYYASVGSGIYLYFAMLTIFCRNFLKRRGKKVGSPAAVKTAYVFSVIWILSSIAMIVLGIQELAYQ